ncbi:Uncharacterised protein g6717 [Pycnogonum litorale]
MGDLLPPKRQAVVERLGRRIEYYRRHMNDMIPRYEQAENGMYDQTKRETLMMKQRFLESKAKKANKKSDNRNTSKSVIATTNNAIENGINDGQRNHVGQQKLFKRSASEAFGSSPLDSNLNHSDPVDDKERCQNGLQDQRNPHDSQNNGLTSFSVQIVQQFSSSTTQAPHSQTIQTNVTVKALPGGNIKTSGSPLPSSTPTGDNSQQIFKEFKQEKVEPDYRSQCSVSSAAAAAPSTVSGSHVTSGANNERFADALSSFITDDSVDDELFQDLINDVFTNTSNADLMKEFNFENVAFNPKDAQENSASSNKPVASSSSSSAAAHQTISPSPPQYSSPSSSLGSHMFDIPQQSSIPMMATSTSTNNRLPSIDMLQSPGASIDFKEPSPAAQTLKQMAEQHQQQKIGNSPHQRTPFSKDGLFSDSMSSLQNSRDFLQTQSTFGNTLQSRNGGGQYSYNQQMAGGGGGGGGGQNISGGANNIYGANMSPNQMSEAELQNRQVMQIQQHLQRIAEQKSPPGYGATKPLTHYADIHVQQQQQQQQAGQKQANSGSGSVGLQQQQQLTGQFVRAPHPVNNGGGGQQYGAIPPSNSNGAIKMSQSQHFTQSNQQIQATQRQQIQIQEMKSQQQTMFNFQQQQQVKASRTSDQIQQMTQSQSATFSSYGMMQPQQQPTSGGVNATHQNVNSVPPRMANPQPRMETSLRGTNNVKQMNRMKMPTAAQMQRPHMMQQQARPPPPEYQSQQQRPLQPRGLVNSGVPEQMRMQQFPPNRHQMMSVQRPTYRTASPNSVQQQSNVVNRPLASNDSQAMPGTVVRPAYANMRNQRSPNVNVGPDGLNITQKAPTSYHEWRQMMIQQQQQQSVGQQQQQQQQRCAPPQVRPSSYGMSNYGIRPGQDVVVVQRPGSVGQQQYPRMQQRLPKGDGNQMLNVEMSSSISLAMNVPQRNSYQQSNSNELPAPNNNNESFNLDFLDNIDSNTAGDLLNIDQVMEMMG